VKFWRILSVCQDISCLNCTIIESQMGQLRELSQFSLQYCVDVCVELLSKSKKVCHRSQFPAEFWIWIYRIWRVVVSHSSVNSPLASGSASHYWHSRILQWNSPCGSACVFAFSVERDTLAIELLLMWSNVTFPSGFPRRICAQRNKLKCHACIQHIFPVCSKFVILAFYCRSINLCSCRNVAE